MHPTIPEDVKSLLAEFETFISDILKGENLSKKAKDKKESLIKKIKDVKSNYPQEFQDKGDSLDRGDEYEQGLFPEAADNISLPSERGDKDEDATVDGLWLWDFKNSMTSKPKSSRSLPSGSLKKLTVGDYRAR